MHRKQMMTKSRMLIYLLEEDEDDEDRKCDTNLLGNILEHLNEIDFQKEEV